MKPMAEVLKDIEKLLSDANVHAVTRDNPILSGRTAEKVQAIVDYACENALYVQMMIPTDIRNRLIELAELDKEYRKNSMAGGQKWRME